MKGLILLEVTIMYGGMLLLQYQSSKSWVNIIINTVPKTLLPSALLLLILLAIADAGAPGIAAALGGLIVIGVWAVNIGPVTSALTAWVGGLGSTSPAPASTPTITNPSAGNNPGAPFFVPGPVTNVPVKPSGGN